MIDRIYEINAPETLESATIKESTSSAIDPPKRSADESSVCDQAGKLEIDQCHVISEKKKKRNLYASAQNDKVSIDSCTRACLELFKCEPS